MFISIVSIVSECSQMATMALEHPATSADQVLLSGCYKLLKTIGKGSYAKVKLAEHLPTGTHVAIKIVNLKNSVSRHRFLM